MKLQYLAIAGMAAVPTGWAIGYGIMRVPAFEHAPVIAGIAGVAVVLVDIFAASLISSIDTFNRTLRNKGERGFTMQTKYAWALLIGAVLAEIFLSLFVVVFEHLAAYAVLVFPALTLAGVFVHSLQADIERREGLRDELRAKSKRKPNATTSKQARKKKKVSRNPITDKQLNDYWLRNPDATNTEVAEHFGVTRQAIGKRKAKLYSVAEKNQ